MIELPRRAVVTGAGRRIGRAFALRLAEAGFDVAVHCNRSRAEAAEVAALICGMGRKAVVVEADLAREPETVTVIRRAQEALGPIGLLVNSASVFELDNLATADRASWDRHLETDLRAPVVLTQELVRLLPPEAAGLVVNVLDQRVLSLTPNFLSYSVAKTGLWAATQVLARELAPRIRLNAIAPGPTLAHPAMSEAKFGELVASTPLRRGPTPDELAAALIFIVDQPSMTGQMLTLDGGQQLGWLTPGDPAVE